MSEAVEIEIERTRIKGITQYLLDDNLKWYRLDPDGTKTYLSEEEVRRLP